MVDKIKDKYEAFQNSTYDVKDAVNRVDTKTQALSNLDVAVTYNYAVWMSNYIGHVQWSETINNIGEFTDLSQAEVAKLNPELDALHAANVEIGNIGPDDYVEDAKFNRITTQFTWGSRYNIPFVHSNDALSAVVSSLGKLGK